ARNRIESSGLRLHLPCAGNRTECCVYHRGRGFHAQSQGVPQTRACTPGSAAHGLIRVLAPLHLKEVERFSSSVAILELHPDEHRRFGIRSLGPVPARRFRRPPGGARSETLCARSQLRRRSRNTPRGETASRSWWYRHFFRRMFPPLPSADSYSGRVLHPSRGAAESISDRRRT